MTPARAAAGTLLGLLLFLAGLYLLVAQLAGGVYGLAAVLLALGAVLAVYCLIADDGSPPRTG